MTSQHGGVEVGGGCRITHGGRAGEAILTPFPAMMPDLVMHQLSASNEVGFKGQLGYIHFHADVRLPRHVHMTADRAGFVAERILVLDGVGLVELAGDYYVVPPGGLVDAVGGVPHTWTACPAGLELPDGSVSGGTFTMVYEYEEPTAFFPTESTRVVGHPRDYRAYEGDLEEIRFPKMSREDVLRRARVVFDGQVTEPALA